MKKIGVDIDVFLASLTGDEERARITIRARQVRDRYKTVIESVYRDVAPLFLEHTNNVYIMNKNGVKTLIVYVDESIFAAELNAQRELIKLKLLEQFGEAVEQFEILVSRGKYKNNHPYILESDQDGAPLRKYEAAPLSEDDKRLVTQTVSSIEDASLKKTLEKAMTASMALNKTENLKRS